MSRFYSVGKPLHTKRLQKQSNKFKIYSNLSVFKFCAIYILFCSLPANKSSVASTQCWNSQIQRETSKN